MIAGFRYRNEGHTVDMPLFDRIESNEFAELQESRRLKEALQRRVADLEKIIVDLEYRLEEQAKINVSVEKESMDIERNWKAKYTAMEQQVEEWRKKCHQQELKADRLREHLSRTERELYGLLQRKYQIMRGPGGNAVKTPHSSSRYADSDKKEDSSSMPLSYSQAPDDMLVSQHTRSPKEIQQRRMLADLSDFFGM